MSIEYIVERIWGDYAFLRQADRPGEEPVQVARALLPEEIYEGSRLLAQECQYTLM